MANKTIGDLDSIALDKDSLLMGYKSNSTGKLTVKDLFDIDLTDQINSSVTDDVSKLKTSVGTLETQVQGLIEGGSGGSSSSNLNNLVDGSTTGSVRQISSNEQGQNNYILGQNAFAEGVNTAASGTGSHVEGLQSAASGDYSHAEGRKCFTLRSYAHAQGYNTSAYGEGSHSQGCDSTARGVYSHAQNYGTTVNEPYGTVIGKYNIGNQNSGLALQIGNGTFQTASNALTIDWGGNVQMALDQSASTQTTDGDLFNTLSNENMLSSTIDSNTNMLDIKKTLTIIIKNQIWNNHWSIYDDSNRPGYDDWADDGIYVNTNYIDNTIVEGIYKNNNFINISSYITVLNQLPYDTSADPIILIDFGNKTIHKIGIPVYYRDNLQAWDSDYSKNQPMLMLPIVDNKIYHYNNNPISADTPTHLFIDSLLPYSPLLK